MCIGSVHISLLSIGACHIDQQRGAPLYPRRLKQPQGIGQGQLSLVQENLRSCIIRTIQAPETDALIASQARTIEVQPVHLLFRMLVVFDLSGCLERLETSFTISESSLYLSFYRRQIGSHGYVDEAPSQLASLLNTKQRFWCILAISPRETHSSPCDGLKCL